MKGRCSSQEACSIIVSKEESISSAQQGSGSISIGGTSITPAKGKKGSPGLVDQTQVYPCNVWGIVPDFVWQQKPASRSPPLTIGCAVPGLINLIASCIWESDTLP